MDACRLIINKMMMMMMLMMMMTINTLLVGAQPGTNSTIFFKLKNREMTTLSARLRLMDER